MGSIEKEIGDIRLGTYYRWRLLRKELSRLTSKTILDVGCNYALFVEELSEKNVAVGIDVDSESLLDAKRRNPALNLLAADAKEIPIGNKTVDCVLCLSIIEHIGDDRKVVSEISRVLKPGGLLILTTTHENFTLIGQPTKLAARLINRIFKTRLPTSDEEYLHFGQEGIGHVRNGYSKESIQKILQRSDLEMTYYGTYWHLPTRLAYPPLMLLLRLRMIPVRLAYLLFNIAIHLDDWIKDERGDIMVRARKE